MNLLDLTYISLNLLVMLLLLYDHEAMLETSRIIAAISVLGLWVRSIEWLRLFENTAFFILVIIQTFVTMKEFLMVNIILYLMFDTALNLLNLGN